MPYLSVAKRGFTKKFDLTEIVNSILYKLKSGCQWRRLPVGHLFNGEPPTWNIVFHHYRKWSRAGEWKIAFTELLPENKDRIDPSLSHMDGSHTPSTEDEKNIFLTGRCIRNGGFFRARQRKLRS